MKNILKNLFVVPLVCLSSLALADAEITFTGSIVESTNDFNGIDRKNLADQKTIEEIKLAEPLLSSVKVNTLAENLKVLVMTYQ